MKIQVYDFFAGVGGTSSGLEAAGFEIAFALDSNQWAINSFKENFPNSKAIQADITEIEPEKIREYIDPYSPKLFCGCAPCQPFSQQNGHKSNNDPRIDLLSYFGRFIEYWLPEYVLVENVPGLQKITDRGPLPDFLKLLKSAGYYSKVTILSSRDFGVPQKRDRLVIVASRLGKVEIPKATHGPGKPNPYSTVKDWISGFPSLKAGETDPNDNQHRAASLSALNLERIRNTEEGKGRETWPDHLLNDCHKNYKGHFDVYGRLAWDRPAAGITTKCTSYSNGRFGHPEQNRAISLREAACLQTFPRNFKFTGTLAEKSRQVGNAVPPLLAKRLGEMIANNYSAIG